MDLENIKKAFDSILGLSQDIIPLFDDGKISKTELIGLLFVAPKIPKVVEDTKKALPAFKKLTPVLAADVAEHIKQKFDIANDELEARIEQGIDLLTRGYQLGTDLYNFSKDVGSYVDGFKAA